MDLTGVGIVRPEPVLWFGKLTSQGSLGQWLGILTPPLPQQKLILGSAAY